MTGLGRWVSICTMTKSTKKIRAIDLYSGAGGWSLGLRLAEVEIVCSYEWWGPANETNFKNNSHQAQTIDIRRLDLADLPKDIDLIVGSPPCTQFSFSNRGGNGDINDGLQDVIKFLTIVDYLRPKYWAMENVPRIAEILKEELQPGGRLARFKHLGIQSTVVNMSNYGVPQRRVRCIAGNIDFDLLRSYANQDQKLTLGDVVRSLNRKQIVDPIYSFSISRQRLTDHVTEEFFTEEEVRINRASKCMHPVYNSMLFPDPLTRTVRTITATCTRVSRESVVIESPEMTGRYRRLSIREKASLQGFPVDYQFYSASYSEKARLVGNAIPPPFAYYVAEAVKGVPSERVPSLSEASKHWKPPTTLAIVHKPPRPHFSYPLTRNFRFAIPSLRLKSGVRFDLTNAITDSGEASWRVAFYFGTSKSIHELEMTPQVYKELVCGLPIAARKAAVTNLENLRKYVLHADVENMQKIWAHRGVGRTAPFMLLDQIDETGEQLISLLTPHLLVAQGCVGEAILKQYGKNAARLPGLAKLARNASLIYAGLLIGCCVNLELIAHARNSTSRLTLKNG